LEPTVAHQRKHFETAAELMKEFSALAQKVVIDTAEPIRTGMAAPFRLAS